MPRRAFLARCRRTAVTLAVLGVGGTACRAGVDERQAADASGGGATSPGPSTEGPTTAAARSGSEAPNPPTEGQVGGDLTWRRVKLSIVSAYIVVRAGEAALIDTGVLGSKSDIEDGLAALDLGWADVGHVLLTHKHDDHTGGLAAVMKLAPQATAYAGAADIPAIAAPRPPTVLTDGEDVFGLRAIATPGHTAGHFSFLDPGGLLLAGDALNGSGDGVVGPDSRYTADMQTGFESVRKLAGLGFDTVLFGHGNPVVGDASAMVEALAAEG